MWFKDIDLGKCSPLKDFGRGFYLTTSYFQAMQHAEDISRDTEAYVYQYELKRRIKADSDVRIVELCKYDKKWLDMITSCRVNGYEPNVDIIYDRIADGKRGNLPDVLNKYESKEIDFKVAIDQIIWRDTKGDQFCFKTLKSLDYIRRTVVYKFMNIEGIWKMVGKERVL